MSKSILFAASVFLVHTTSAKADLKVQNDHSGDPHVIEQSVVPSSDQSVPSRQQVEELFSRGSQPKIPPKGAWAGNCYSNGKAESAVLVFFRKDFRLTFDVFGSGKSDNQDPYFFDKLNGREARRLVVIAPWRTPYKYSGIEMGSGVWRVGRNGPGSHTGSHTCSLKLRQAENLLLYSWDDGLDYCTFRKRIDRGIF